jgi:Rrf2 family nitric oxide-sensitive transcriptional repressor
MHLTRQTEIAIGILTICGSAPSRKVQTRYLAERSGTTKDHAAHVVALLVRNGLLASERGRSGGIRLAAEPDSVSLAEVIRLTQPELVQDKAGTQPAHGSGVAALDMIVGASAAFFARLVGRFTIADLVARNGVGRIGCLECSLVNPARLTPRRAPAPSSTLPPRDAAASRTTTRDGRPIATESLSRHDQLSP